MWHCTEKWLKDMRIMNNNNENKVVEQYTLTGGQLHQHPSEPLLLAVERMGKPSHEKPVKIPARDLRNVAAVGVVMAK